MTKHLKIQQQRRAVFFHINDKRYKITLFQTCIHPTTKWSTIVPVLTKWLLSCLALGSKLVKWNILVKFDKIWLILSCLYHRKWKGYIRTSKHCITYFFLNPPCHPQILDLLHKGKIFCHIIKKTVHLPPL